MKLAELSIQAPLQEWEDGSIRFRSTRVPVDRLLFAFRGGQTPEWFVEQFPTVTLRDAYAAIACYLDHQQAFDEYVERQEREGDEAERLHRQKSPQDELRARLLKRWQERNASTAR